MINEWRTVPSLPDYEVTAEGLIRRKAFTGKMPYGGVRNYGGGDGFMGVWAKDQNRFHITYKRRTYKVHRLICEAFHGPPPFPRAVVMHIDDDSANNRIENLKWATQKENLNSEKFIAYCKSRTGENSRHAVARRKRLAASPLP